MAKTAIFGVKTVGLAKVERSFDRRLSRIAGKTKEGMLLAAQHIQRKADETVPIDTGNLAASAFAGLTGGIGAVMGYSASYALAVHEREEATFKRRKSKKRKGSKDARAKWLEKTFEEESEEVFAIIARNATVAVRG